MLTSRWCGYHDYAKGGQHGCDLDSGMGGLVSRTGAGVHAAHVHHVSAHRRRVGTLPDRTLRVAADGQYATTAVVAAASGSPHS